MTPATAIVGMLGFSLCATVVLAQGNPCKAGGKQYDSGTVVCMRGFEQRCENGAWSNQQRFCSEDSQFEMVREPEVAVPPANRQNQPAVPPADNPSKVLVPAPQE